jgi:uncharacterized membrane protein YecN with MAPEG domain
MTFTFLEVAEIAVWLINSLGVFAIITAGVVVGAWVLLKVPDFLRRTIGL